MSEVLWDIRRLDPGTGTATEHQTITFEGDTVAAIGDAVGEAPEGRTISPVPRSSQG